VNENTLGQPFREMFSARQRRYTMHIKEDKCFECKYSREV